MRSNDEGFTILEVLIAGAIVVLMALTGLAACRMIAQLTSAAFTTGYDSTALDTQAAQLRDDAASALAVFVPTTDMTGAPNRESAQPHEIDYYSRGDNGSAFLWRYYYDATRRTLRRYDFDSNGTNGVRDAATGQIHAGAQYPPLRDVTSFQVETVAANALGDVRLNVYGGLGALFEHTPDPQSISFNDSRLNMPDARGGNAIVQVTLATAHAARIVHLMAGTMPAGFTVTGLPRWHAILFRVDQSNRSWIGLAGKSHVFINARIDVTYDDWASRVPWCIFNVLGNPDGLDGGDPHANYTPNEPFESAESLLNRCRAMNPTPPPRNSAGNPPEEGTVTEPLPLPTPPACWSRPGPQGRCWPPDAPPNWSPPSPAPVDTPPPLWCATHAQSVACAKSTVRTGGQ